MVLILTDAQSIAYLDGGWSAYRVEEDGLDDVTRQGIREPVAAVLSDGTTAFCVTEPGVIL